MKEKVMVNRILYPVMFLLFYTSLAASQTLFVDDFIYGPLSNLNGTNGWQQSGATHINKVTVVSPGLTYSGYQGSGFGNAVYFNNITEGELVLHDFSPVTSGSVYYACMVNVSSLTDSATQGYNITFDPSGGVTSHTASLFIKRVTPTLFNFGIRKSSGVPAFSNTAHIIATTCVVVVRYTFVPGSSGNDTCKLYVLTSGVPAIEPSNPDAVTAFGADVNDIGQIGLSNSYSQSGLKGSHVKIDGIRIGTTWFGAVATGLNITGTEVPADFSLQQNYPNPFNPVTNIGFTVPGLSWVTLKIYDTSGKEAAVLVNQQLSAGTYKYDFDASGLSSGAYFYRITAGDFTAVKKMMLIK